MKIFKLILDANVALLPINGIPIRTILEFFLKGYPYVSHSISEGGDVNSYQYLFNLAIKQTLGYVKIYLGDSGNKIPYNKYSYNLVVLMFNPIDDLVIDIKALLLDDLFSKTNVKYYGISRDVLLGILKLSTKTSNDKLHFVLIDIDDMKVNCLYLIHGLIKCSSVVTIQAIDNVPYSQSFVDFDLGASNSISLPYMNHRRT